MINITRTYIQNILYKAEVEPRPSDYISAKVLGDKLYSWDIPIAMTFEQPRIKMAKKVKEFVKFISGTKELSTTKKTNV